VQDPHLHSYLPTVTGHRPSTWVTLGSGTYPIPLRRGAAATFQETHVRKSLRGVIAPQNVVHGKIRIVTFAIGWLMLWAMPSLALAGSEAPPRDAQAKITPGLPPPLLARPRNELSDAEPVDPAEERPAIVPPTRSKLRGVVSTWQALGPSPTESAQLNVPPNDEVSGAIHAIAAHPTDANTIYVAAVNGGIWKTSNATAAQPVWIPQTEDLPSQSIGAIAFDPSDVTHQTLIAGTGRWSNFAQRGDDETGIYYTTDGGANWTHLGATPLLGQKILGVSARGAVLMAASRTGGLFRSIDTGASWTLVSGTGGLPTGGVSDLEADPADPLRFYTAVLGTTPRLFRSDNGGANWIEITTGITGLGSGIGAIRFSVGAASTVYVATVDGGALEGVFRSITLGSAWTPMDVPNVHPGGQGSVNTAIVADPVDINIVYLSGDRITASPFTGNLARGNAAAPLGSQFTSIMDGNAGNTAPHADSRDMEFDANGNLLQSDDGGLYRRSNPTSSAGTWASVVGNLNVMEVHDLAHDRVADIITIGTQDNGTHMQQTASNPRWVFINGGDGGDIAADSVSLAPLSSFRYVSSQNLGGFRRVRFSNTNAQQASLGLPTIADPQFVTPIELNRANKARMLVGGVSTLYESTNINTGSPTLTSLGGPGANRSAMVYGSHTDANVAYVGKNAAVFKLNFGVFAATGALPAGAATVTDVTMDPDDPNRVFAIDDNQVFRSINGGATWQDVTGDLTSMSSLDFRTIEFIADLDGDSVAIGTRSGVFTAAADASTWSMLGAGLPDVLVFDLQYLPGSRSLIAGTLGRGVWRHTFPPGNGIFANSFEF
jgi:photosystem II stability/assembly factor-like uncharacterized protein